MTRNGGVEQLVEVRVTTHIMRKWIDPLPLDTVWINSS